MSKTRRELGLREYDEMSKKELIEIIEDYRESMMNMQIAELEEEN